MMDLAFCGETLSRTIQAMGLWRWILALAIMCTGLVSLTVASHVRGAAAPIGHARPTPVIELIVSPSAESAQPAAAASGTQPSPALSDAKFRFGFLEFEDDVDAPPR
jgi:hypothetical protein